MIFTERKITINNNQCKIDSPVVLYRGDYNVEIRFTLVSSPYKYSSKQEMNIIEQTEASYGQLVIKTPGDKAPIFSEITATKRGAITFTIAAEMIDEIGEVGDYTFQIRLLDENKESRATIPEVKDGIEIREPIAKEDVTATNEVNVATVGYAMTTAATAEDAFDSQGNYNKTTWGPGERITDAKLNKMEAGIDGVNKKVASGGTGSSGANIDDTTASTTTTYSSNKIETIKEGLSSQINTIENEKLDKNGIITMANIGQDIKEAMTGGSVAVVGKNTILTENIVNKQVTEDKVNFLNGYENIWTFGDNLDFKITQLNAYQNRPYTITEGFVSGDILLFSIGEAINCTDNAIAELKICKEDGTVLNSLWMTKTNKQQTIKVLDGSVKITVELFLSQATAFSEPCTVSFKNIKLIKNGDLSYEIADNIKVDYSNLINVKITKDDTDIFDPCLNLYDYSTSLLKKAIDKNNGQISDVDNFILSDYIEVKSENEYYKRLYGDVVFFDSSKTFMSGITLNGKMNFTTPKNCKYIRVNIAGIDNLQYEVVAPSTADHTFVMPTGTQFIKNDMIDVRKFYNWYGKKFVSFGHSIVAMQRWQQYVADYFGLKHTCCGQGGSPVAGESFTGGDGEVKIPMWKDERINAIPEDTDLILILCGLNDYETCKNNMGNINDTDTNTFYGAYNTMLSKLYTRCPNARIVIMNDLFRAIQPGINREVEDNTRDAIRLISKKYNYPLIDSTEYGINDLNYTVFYEANDPVHPSYVGGKRIADVVIGKLKTISPYNSELN